MSRLHRGEAALYSSLPLGGGVEGSKPTRAFDTVTQPQIETNNVCVTFNSRQSQLQMNRQKLNSSHNAEEPGHLVLLDTDEAGWGKKNQKTFYTVKAAGCDVNHDS